MFQVLKTKLEHIQKKKTLNNNQLKICFINFVVPTGYTKHYQLPT